MKSPRLGVNIDHVATIRNARGEKYPSPLRAALIVEKYKADSVTIHLREDRRHIKDRDLAEIKKKIKIPLNLEIAPTSEMLKIALKYKPDYVCIVPEKRKEITTEGGLNLKKNFNLIKNIIKKLHRKNIRTSLFIEPNIEDIKISKKIKADCVEIHTGKICSLFNLKKNTNKELHRIKKAVQTANKIGLEVHAGHGITFSSAKILSNINGIEEFNIGHFLIGESIFIGIKNSIGKFKKILKR
jgi:pyridoxine 5''-phosphate synthase